MRCAPITDGHGVPIAKPGSTNTTTASAHDLTRSKLVFRAYLDARACGEDDEAAELFALWLRLLGRERAP